MTTNKDLLLKLVDAPPEVMDEPFRDMLKAVVAKDVITSDDIHNLLDNIAFAASATPFLQTVLDITWRAMLKEEGKTVEQAVREKHS